MKPIDLQHIESRSWRSFQRTGLLDVYVGMLLLSLVTASLIRDLTGSSWLSLAALIALQGGGFGFYRWGRRALVEPRLGAVRFGASRRQSLERLRGALIVCTVVTAGIVVLTATRNPGLRVFFDTLGAYGMPTAVAIIVGVPVAAIAYVLETPRLLIHGALVIASFFVRAGLESVLCPAWLSLVSQGTAAVTSLAIGGCLLGRFLRTTKRIEFREESHG